MSQQRPNARRTSKRPTIARGEQKQVSEQSEPSSLPSIRPSNDDHAAWLAYWQKQNQPWRIEPEINIERQKELKSYLGPPADIKKYIYPFKGIKLDRADIEWLLAIYDDEHGPVDRRKDKQKEADRLNICGANLHYTDLHDLPLTQLQGGIVLSELMDKLTGKPFSLLGPELQESLLSQLTDTMIVQIIEFAEIMRVDIIVAQLEGANLSGAQLEGANLVGVHLERANLSGAQLKGANLVGVHLEGANLSGAQLEGVNLFGAHLERANLSGAQLKGANLFRARLEGADLSSAQLKGANLSEAWFIEANLSKAWLLGTNLSGVQLARASLSGAYLMGADLSRADLVGADLSGAQLARANLSEAVLRGADLSKAHLAGANLDGAYIESANLCGAQLKGVDLAYLKLSYHGGVGPQLADVRWDDTNLFLVDWETLKVLADENKALDKSGTDGKKKDKNTRLKEYKAAARAYRQLAVALQTQGLGEDASRFAYHAQRLQRVILRRKRKLVAYLFSGFLDLIAGYGYRPGRTVLWYLFVIVGFAAAYFAFGHLPLFPDAFVFSLMSFHGRGFFPSLSSETSLHNQVVEIAAIEAVVGLLIEISFIATFTQRYFGK